MVYYIQTDTKFSKWCMWNRFSLGGMKGERSSEADSSTRRERPSRSSAHLPKTELPPRGQCCGEETLKQAAPSNNNVKKGLLQVQALLFLTLYGAL